MKPMNIPKSNVLSKIGGVLDKMVLSISLVFKGLNNELHFHITVSIDPESLGPVLLTVEFKFTIQTRLLCTSNKNISFGILCYLIHLPECITVRKISGFT